MTTADDRSTRRLRTIMWVVAIGIAVIGIVLAIVTWSPVPLVAIVLGLALPLLPLRTPMTSR